MKTVTLTPESVDLLLVLLQAHRDMLEHDIKLRLGPRAAGWSGKVPTNGEVREAQELLLTTGLIRTLEKS